MNVQLIVGLGNPGRIYRNTWHNMGAATIEKLAGRWGVKFAAGKGDFIYADARKGGRKVTLLIPTSYMNRSGGPVSAWLRYHRVSPDEILVVYDDHDLPLGRIRIRPNGSSGGHRGMDDIIRLVGSENIPRIRIGIRSEKEKGALASQVLSKIPKKLRDSVEGILDAAADAVEKTVTDGITPAMNEFNNFTIDYSG